MTAADAMLANFDTMPQPASRSFLCRSRTAVAPLERLKILMQVQGSSKLYTGVWQVFI